MRKTSLGSHSFLRLLLTHISPFPLSPFPVPSTDPPPPPPLFFLLLPFFLFVSYLPINPPIPMA